VLGHVREVVVVRPEAFVDIKGAYGLRMGGAGAVDDAAADDDGRGGWRKGGGFFLFAAAAAAAAYGLFIVTGGFFGTSLLELMVSYYKNFREIGFSTMTTCDDEDDHSHDHDEH